MILLVLVFESLIALDICGVVSKPTYAHGITARIGNHAKLVIELLCISVGKNACVVGVAQSEAKNSALTDRIINRAIYNWIFAPTRTPFKLI